MADTFAPSVIPTRGSGGEVEYRYRSVSFGDGYEQRAPDGLNTRRETTTLEWSALTHTSAQEITDWFDAHAPPVSFHFQLPWEGTSRRWILKSVRQQTIAQQLVSLTAELREVHDL